MFEDLHLNSLIGLILEINGILPWFVGSNLCPSAKRKSSSISNGKKEFKSGNPLKKSMFNIKSNICAIQLSIIFPEKDK